MKMLSIIQFFPFLKNQNLGLTLFLNEFIYLLQLSMHKIPIKQQIQIQMPFFLLLSFIEDNLLIKKEKS